MRCRVARDCEHDVSPCEPLNYPDDSEVPPVIDKDISWAEIVADKLEWSLVVLL